MNEPIKLVEDLTLLTPAVPGSGFAWSGWLPLAAVAFGFVIARLLRRRKARALRVVPPGDTALAALDAVLARIDELDAREFALRLSLVLRVYIEGRFGLRAPTRSTEEFLAEAGRSPRLSDGEQRFIGEFLGYCDQPKFALADLAVEAKHQLHASARTFVLNTRAVPPVVA